jgi:hypothetical protein
MGWCVALRHLKANCNSEREERGSHRPNKNSTQILGIPREIPNFWV